MPPNNRAAPERTKMVGLVAKVICVFKLYARFRKMFAREIGWKHFKDAYAARLEADFSEDELKELLNLSKQPVMKKLLQSEVEAYMDTSKQRFKMGFELWDNYNNGKISLPPD